MNKTKFKIGELVRIAAEVSFCANTWIFSSRANSQRSARSWPREDIGIVLSTPRPGNTGIFVTPTYNVFWTKLGKTIPVELHEMEKI